MDVLILLFTKKPPHRKETKLISERHREFIDDIQNKCADIIELEPEEKQGSIVATVCANIIQGFDTQEEMNLVIEMIQNAINEYWKLDDIPQKQEEQE